MYMAVIVLKEKPKYNLWEGAYGKAGNGNKTETGNGNWKRKPETENRNGNATSSLL